MAARTFSADLDESSVPGQPGSLSAERAGSDRIELRWRPPSDKSVAVRGYTVGWGKGIPDENTKVVDDKQRGLVIKDLKVGVYLFGGRKVNSTAIDVIIYSFFKPHLEET